MTAIRYNSRTGRFGAYDTKAHAEQTDQPGETYLSEEDLAQSSAPLQYMAAYYGDLIRRKGFPDKEAAARAIWALAGENLLVEAERSSTGNSVAVAGHKTRSKPVQGAAVQAGSEGKSIPHPQSVINAKSAYLKAAGFTIKYAGKKTWDVRKGEQKICSIPSADFALSTQEVLLVAIKAMEISKDR